MDTFQEIMFYLRPISTLAEIVFFLIRFYFFFGTIGFGISIIASETPEAFPDKKDTIVMLKNKSFACFRATMFLCIIYLIVNLF